MVFPNWGAMSSNVINAKNKKSVGLVGKHIPTRKPTRKDWIIGTLYLIIPIVILWALMIIVLYLDQVDFIKAINYNPATDRG
jgi:hypothetical protein